MALLNFKLGEFKNLAGVAKSAGTVYITKDEQAMYVDVDNSTRIRIGDIIQLDSVRNAQPPFSSEALYYFIKENALLKWVEYVDESDGQTKHKWQQLNNVSDLQANINELINTVNSNSGRIATLDSKITDLEAKDKELSDAIVANQEAIASNATELTDLTTRMSEVEAKANTTATNFDTLQDTVNTLSGTVATHNTAIEELKPRVKALEDAVGKEDDGNTILGRLKTDEAAIKANTEAIGTDTTKDTVKYRITQLESTTNDYAGKLANHEDAITKLQEAVGTSGDGNSLASRVSAIEAEQKTQNDNISAAQAQANKGVTDAAAAQKAADDAAATANANAGRLTTIEGTGEGSIAKAVGDEQTRAAAAEAALGTRIDGLATEIGDSTSGMKKSIADNAAAIATNLNSINTINGQIATINGSGEGSIKKAVADAKEALSAEIDADINAANAMNYIKNIGAYAELPAVSDGIHIGDTYVVGTAFKNGDVQYNAGDMLIASSSEEEDANGNIKEGTLSWNHVKTGYDVANEPSLSGASNAISLLSHLGTNLGSIIFKDGGSGIKATVANNEVTLSIEWGTFGEE